MESVRQVVVEVDEELFRRVERLRSAGIVLRDVLLKGVEHFERELLERGRELELVPGIRVRYRLAETLSSYVFKWPSGVEEFEEAKVFEVTVDGDVMRIVVAYGFREAFGARRRKVVVFNVTRVGRRPEPVTEFTGADSWSTTKHIVGLIRRPDKGFMKLEEVGSYREYEVLKQSIVDHGEAIKGGRRGYAALCVREDDTDTIIYYTVLRLKLKSGK